MPFGRNRNESSQEGSGPLESSQGGELHNERYTLTEVQNALAEFRVYHSDGAKNSEELLDAHRRTLEGYIGLAAYPDEKELKTIQSEVAKYSNYTGSKAGKYIAEESLAILQPIESLIQAKIQAEKEREQGIKDVQDKI